MTFNFLFVRQRVRPTQLSRKEAANFAVQNLCLNPFSLVGETEYNYLSYIDLVRHFSEKMTNTKCRMDLEGAKTEMTE